MMTRELDQQLHHWSFSVEADFPGVAQLMRDAAKEVKSLTGQLREARESGAAAAVMNDKAFMVFSLSWKIQRLQHQLHWTPVERYEEAAKMVAERDELWDILTTLSDEGVRLAREEAEKA